MPEENTKKRKLDDVPEIEIDVSAPEPPSKKALRKAKKKGISPESLKTAAKTEAKAEATTESEAENKTETKTEKPKKKSAKQRSEYGIWIGNLAFTVTKDDLRKFLTSNCSFSEATITRIHLPMGPAKDGASQNKGFAYIDFSTKKAMEEAMGLSEQLLSGRRVLIKGAKDFEGRPEQHQQPGASKSSGNPPSRKIFIGNLAFDATKEMLEEHFSRCGTVTNVHVATFEDSGKCKGFAWVEFETVEAAEAAVKGFVKVKEEESDDEEEEGEEQTGSDAEEKPAKSETKKSKTKKIWVNRFLGRQLRMEFAEDPTTRYKKRFGKGAKGKKGKDKDKTSDEDALVENDAVNGDSGEASQANHATKERRKKKDKQQKQNQPRYSKETVQRLTGAIVEPQGKKITFDES